jgi:hypothetical protein
MSIHDTDNYTLGKGVLYFNYKKNGVYQGFRDLGNAPSFNMSLDLDVLDHFSSRSGMASKDKKVVRMATPKCAFTLDEINPENMALTFMGAATENTQAYCNGQADALSVIELDKWYFNSATGKRKIKACTYLSYDGGTGAFAVAEVVTGAGGAQGTVEAIIGNTAAGILVLSDVTGTYVNDEALTGSALGAASAHGTQVVGVLVCNSDGTTVYTETTDYTLDLDVGRVFAKSTGSIAASSTIYLAYAANKCTYNSVAMIEDAELEGELHFISDNPVGKNYELLLWRVALTPSGDTGFIGEDWASMGFEGEILKDETGHPLTPYGTVIEEATVVATTTT